MRSTGPSGLQPWSREPGEEETDSRTVLYLGLVVVVVQKSGCITEFLLSQCVSKVYPTTRIDIPELFDRRSDLMVVSTRKPWRISILEEAVFYSVVRHQHFPFVRGHFETKLPACFIDWLRTVYPNPTGEFSLLATRQASMTNDKNDHAIADVFIKRKPAANLNILIQHKFSELQQRVIIIPHRIAQKSSSSSLALIQ
jgi:hypothetical protein